MLFCSPGYRALPLVGHTISIKDFVSAVYLPLINRSVNITQILMDCLPQKAFGYQDQAITYHNIRWYLVEFAAGGEWFPLLQQICGRLLQMQGQIRRGEMVVIMMMLAGRIWRPQSIGSRGRAPGR
jgi:hypothetical protein